MATDYTNTRFELISGTADFETAAPEIFIAWDPITNGGSVTFNHAKYLRVDEEVRPDVPGIRNGSITISLQDFMTRVFGQGLVDPVTQAQINLSGYGLMLYAKAMFNTLHNEAHASEPTP